MSFTKLFTGRLQTYAKIGGIVQWAPRLYPSPSFNIYDGQAYFVLHPFPSEIPFSTYQEDRDLKKINRFCQKKSKKRKRSLIYCWKEYKSFIISRIGGVNLFLSIKTLNTLTHQFFMQLYSPMCKMTCLPSYKL